MPGRRAGSPIAVYARVQPKTGQEKVKFYFFLIHSSCHLSMDINVKATTELGLRQHYRDNVTLLSVHKIVVDY